MSKRWLYLLFILLQLGGTVPLWAQSDVPHLEITESIPNQELQFPVPKLDAEQSAVFESLSPSDQQEFLKHREFFLTSLQRILSWGKLGFGTGSLVKETVVQYVPFKPGLSRPEDYTLLHLFEDESTTPEKTGLSEKGRRVMAAILRTIDMQLWTAPRLVIDSNEFGGAFLYGKTAGIIGHGRATAEADATQGRFGRVLSRFRGKGLTFAMDIGASLSYNKKTKTVYFDVFGDVEWFRRNLVPYPQALLGIKTFRGDIFISSRSTDPYMKGRIAYPPMGGSFMISPTYLSIGYPFTYGLPTTPADSFIAYENNVLRVPVVSVSVGPNRWGWVRVDFPARGFFTLSFMKSKFNALKARFGRSSPSSAPTCGKSLSS